MSVSISAPDNCLETEFFIPQLQASLKTFVDQFTLSGCAVLGFDLGRQKVEQLGYCNPLPADFFPLWAAAIDWAQATTLPLFEPRGLPAQPYPGIYQLYGCPIHRGSASCTYLLCWQKSPLSAHQSYGIHLYTQALSQQFLSSLEQQDRQSMTEVLQCVRHQLRTPLALILLYADLLDGVGGSGRSREWLVQMRQAIEEMHYSLNHLTKSAERVPGKSPACNLRPLLEQCGQMLQPWLDAKQVRVAWDPHPLWLPVDPWKMKQVLQNLLSNAIAFSPIGGQITWEWQVFQTEVLITLRDQGPGLSAEDLRSLGTPFYSRRPGGTGLGLTIAKQILQEYKGSLWAENLPDRGAQFCITLPRCPELHD